MQIFEFHFNPKIKEDRIFDSFIYEPENSYERKLGSLYMVGDLKNTLPQNLRFLDNLASAIKKKYYSLSYKSGSKALIEGSKSANDFLAEEVKKENISWLGNLSFAALSLDQFSLHFIKTGDIKILLLRGGKINDIGKGLELQEIEPYPLKVFFNIVSGGLMENDLILVLTKDIFDFFIEEKIIGKIARTKTIDRKTLKEILPQELFTKGKGADVSGICFLISLKKERINLKGIKEIVSRQKENIYLAGFKKYLKRIRDIKIYQRFKNIVGYFRKLSLKIHPLSFFKRQKDVKKVRSSKSLKTKGYFSYSSNIKELIKNPEFRKKLILIIVLLAILILGFIIFKKNKDYQETKIINSVLKEAEEKLSFAQNLINADNQDEAISVLKAALLEITPYIKGKSKPEIASLKNDIETQLYDLNNFTEIENPKPIADLDANELGFNPSSILSLGSNFYLFSHNSSLVLKLNSKGERVDLTNLENNLEMGSASSSIYFFSRPNNLIFLKNGVWQKETLLKEKPDYMLFASYNFNLYFIDINGEIIKYSYNGLNWNQPQIWLKNQISDKKEPKSLSIDESIWVLNSDNSIYRYFKGDYQESFIFDVFPNIQEIAKIKTKPGLSYLYLLEPETKRIIVADKNKRIIKQFQSDKFYNLKDFDISDDGKIIWVLSDNKIYQIEL
ncbi:MAG: hypothetical protein PHI53_00320 [Candidatus Pacebacteria bacterium]|nr:hypothetical protein [Candidatus Paceibacterota bacterium]